MLSFTKRVFLSFRRPVFVYLATLSITVQLCFAGLFYAAEKGFNQAVPTFFDAFYYTVTIMTGVGLGDIHPTTLVGKAISIVMMLSGTVLFVCFAGVLTASIMQLEGAE